MAALSADKVRQYAADIDPLFLDIPIKAATTLYEGEALSDDGGNGVADSLAVNETFLGFCEKGGTASSTANEIKCKVRRRGVVKGLPVTGVTGVTDLGVTVYADSDNDFTLTSSGNNVSIGKVERFVATGYADVYFEAASVRSL